MVSVLAVRGQGFEVEERLVMGSRIFFVSNGFAALFSPCDLLLDSREVRDPAKFPH